MQSTQTSFSRARVTLTLWYCLTLFTIITLFSFALYGAQSQNFARVVLLRDFGNRPPRLLTRIEKLEILEQVRELRKNTFTTLLLLDAGIMLIGAGLSFFLAGKTLEPIEKVHAKQREFLANASHELRTPLAVLQTSTEVMLRGEHKTKDDYKEVLVQTYEEAKRLGKIVNDLLVLSRVDSNAMEIEMRKVTLTKIIAEIIEQLSPFAKERGIIMQTNSLESVTIVGDEDKLKQLVLILLDNAIKYSHENGTIVLSLSNKPKPVLTITDSGIGMSQQQIHRIFERFYRADESRSTVGAGLGLAIAKYIADMHNAKITVTSSKGAGTTFQVIFS